MRIKENKWDECKCCGQRTKLIQEESFGCDNCKKPIDDLLQNPDNVSHHYLEVTVHYRDSSSSKRYQFCSWKCCFRKLRSLKTDYFIALPFLNFDIHENGQTAKDFFKFIKVGKP